MKIILGIAGEMASGKGTVAKYLEEKHQASAHRFSTMLRNILDRLYLEHSRENMQKMSTILRQAYGEDTLARVMAEDVKNDTSKIIVIDGVRRLDDIKYLKKSPGFKLIYIEATIQKRYDRIIQRSENADDQNKTFAEFEKEHQGEPELQIKDLKNYADIVVDNNGGMEELYRQVDEVIRNDVNKKE